MACIEVWSSSIFNSKEGKMGSDGPVWESKTYQKKLLIPGTNKRKFFGEFYIHILIQNVLITPPFSNFYL